MLAYGVALLLGNNDPRMRASCKEVVFVKLVEILNVEGVQDTSRCVAYSRCS